MSMPNIQAGTHAVTRQALTEHLEALIALIEGAHDTHFYSEDDEHPVDCVYCAVVAGAGATLATLPDNSIWICVGCWYGQGGAEVALPAVYVNMPPEQEGGVRADHLMEVYDQYLDTIEPSDRKLDEFIHKWEKYARKYGFSFETSDVFERVDGCWQVVVED